MTARTRLRDDLNFLRVMAQIRVRDKDNVTRIIKRVRIRNTSNLTKIVYQSLVAAVSPSTVAAYGSTGAAANLTTGQAIAAPVGGQTPFTYAWVQKTVSPYTWTINSPSAAATDFTITSLPAGAANSVDFEVTITDATGISDTATITATANNGLPYNPYVAPPTIVITGSGFDGGTNIQ
jgi:hypothetical protein